ncbi:hypothetical protein BH09ACT8_BH09ACT8_43400 [soil metagenome]
MTVATLTRQCWLFAIGSSLFALATVPGFPALTNAVTANALCFIGSWFFTSAAWMQLRLSGQEWTTDWLSAAIQFLGTILFNVSTGSAVVAHAVLAQRRLVWAPDATGSIAFLISGVLGVVAVSVAIGRLALKSRDWQAEWVNLVGCVAFGVSAVAAFVSKTGVTEDAKMANLGTFIGALCFLAAALMVLPRGRSQLAGD